MKTFAEQLQEYVNASKNEKRSRQRFLKGKRIQYLGHMFDLLRLLGVIEEVKSSSTLFTTSIDQHTLVYGLVNRYYGDHR